MRFSAVIIDYAAHFDSYRKSGRCRHPWRQYLIAQLEGKLEPGGMLASTLLRKRYLSVYAKHCYYYTARLFGVGEE